MTEEEAKKKWCPMIRHISDATGGAFMNNRGEHPSHVNCIASDCMMWKDDYSLDEQNQEFYKDGGYCGLTG